MKIRIPTKDGSLKTISMNRRRAIRENCLNCSAWSPSEVRDCEIADCELHPFRTGQGSQDADERAKAIRNFCLDCAGGQALEVSKCHILTCPLHPYRQTRIDRTAEVVADSVAPVEKRTA